MPWITLFYPFPSITYIPKTERTETHQKEKFNKHDILLIASFYLSMPHLPNHFARSGLVAESYNKSMIQFIYQVFLVWWFVFLHILFSLLHPACCQPWIMFYFNKIYSTPKRRKLLCTSDLLKKIKTELHSAWLPLCWD